MLRKLKGPLKVLLPRGPAIGPRLCRQVKPRRRESILLLPIVLTVMVHHRRGPEQPRTLPPLKNENYTIDVAIQCTGALGLIPIRKTLKWIPICLDSVTIVRKQTSSAVRDALWK